MTFIKHHTIKWVGLISIVVLGQTLTHTVWAAGTASGVDISNQATVSYSVSGLNQTDINSNTVTFTVDALVDLTVTGTGNQNVTPNGVFQLEFTVTNTGNETYDFTLASEAGVEDFNVSDLTIHVDSNNNGTWDGPGTDLPGTSIDNLAADASTKAWLVGTIPATATDNQSAAYHLMASALLADGNPIPAEATDVATTKQYVYADASGPHSSDNVRDTQHSASLSFVAQTANLTVVKSSTVLWDPVNLGTNPLHIPGAIVEYTIQISNGSGAETASNIVVTDVLDANLILPASPPSPYSDGNSIQLTTPNLYGGATTVLTNASDSDEASVSGQTVTVTGITLSDGESATVTIVAELQ